MRLRLEDSAGTNLMLVLVIFATMALHGRVLGQQTRRSASRGALIVDLPQPAVQVAAKPLAAPLKRSGRIHRFLVEGPKDIVVAPGSVAPEPVQGLTVEVLEDLASKSNPSILRANAQISAARGRAYQVGLRPNPEIGMDFQQLGSEGLAEQYGIMVRQEMVRGQKWGRAVNPEYEAVRADSDGDGLSDAWEKINGRNPMDGKLLFTFDCGGWQTEGWAGSPGLGNIAGRQGYLDFSLDGGDASLVREGLKLSANKNRGYFTVVARADHDISVEFMATNATQNTLKPIVRFDIQANRDWSTLSIPLPENGAWQGLIKSLELKIKGPSGTLVEFDSISIP